ncbi:MAG TPA: DUF4397 domain-containing protein [Gemmatimonadaceae bacterium]|nr:DUF4397 domain-containing protein [Gemmatimonadaceae bacterium]
MKLRTFSALALVAAALVAVACTNDDDNFHVGPTTQNASVRFVNASTQGLNIDVASNGTVGTGNGNLAFGSSSSCITTDVANPGLTVRSAGDTTALTGFTPTFQAGQRFTVIVGGTQAAPTFLTLRDTTASSTGGFLRVVNLTSDTSTFNVFATAASDTTLPATANAQVGTGVAQNSGFFAVPAGSTQIRFTAASDTTKAVVFSPTAFTVANGDVQTLVLADSTAGATGHFQAFVASSCPLP